MAILHDELHWLDVPERIEYELGVMVYRCLHGQTPCCLADHLIPASDAVWNSLPDGLRNSDSFDSFKRFMKTYFSLAATSG